jgi:acetolactate synthase small subunit
MNLPLIIRRILYGGSGRLYPTEQSLLEAVRGRLSAEDALTLDEQVRDIEFVQNQNNHVVAVWHRRETQAREFADKEFCLAKVRLEEKGRKSSATIGVYKGRLQTFEYTRRPKKDFSVLDVQIRPKKAISTAAALNRLEHGNEE